MKQSAAPSGDVMAGGAGMSPRKAIASGMGPGKTNFGVRSFADVQGSKPMANPSGKRDGKSRAYNQPR